MSHETSPSRDPIPASIVHLDFDVPGAPIRDDVLKDTVNSFIKRLPPEPERRRFLEIRSREIEAACGGLLKLGNHVKDRLCSDGDREKEREGEWYRTGIILGYEIIKANLGGKPVPCIEEQVVIGYISKFLDYSAEEVESKNLKQLAASYSEEIFEDREQEVRSWDDPALNYLNSIDISNESAEREGLLLRRGVLDAISIYRLHEISQKKDQDFGGTDFPREIEY